MALKKARREGKTTLAVETAEGALSTALGESSGLANNTGKNFSICFLQDTDCTEPKLEPADQHPASTPVSLPFPSEPTKAQGTRQKEKGTACHRANHAQAQDEERTWEVLGNQGTEQKVKVLDHEHHSPDVHLLRDRLIPYHLRGHPRHCSRKGHFGTFIAELFRCTKV